MGKRREAAPASVSSGGGRDYSISVVRAVALLMIIVCHILQVLELELAYWFNVGVQVFLCISGFLYGKRDVGESVGFYLGRLKKILIPYYIAFLPFAAALFLFARAQFSAPVFLKALVCGDTLEGGGHLWFVPTILMCYLLTPLLQACRDRYIRAGRDLILYAVISNLIFLIFFGIFAPFYNPAWIGCYVLGYLLGVNDKRRLLPQGALLGFFGVLAVAGNGLQITCDYIAHVQLGGVGALVYKVFSKYNHVFLGVFLFLLLRRVFAGVSGGKEKHRLLDTLDEYSYAVYLVHLFVIKGAFSMVRLTGFLPLNILLILAAVAVMALIVRQLERLILRFLPPKKQPRETR